MEAVAILLVQLRGTVLLLISRFRAQGKDTQTLYTELLSTNCVPKGLWATGGLKMQEMLIS